MRFVVVLVVVLFLSSSVYSQSGRRAKEVKVPAPPPEQEVKEPKPKPPEEPPPVTAEKNQEYRCTDDGSLARILDADDVDELVVSTKEVDTRLVIKAKPQPSYTKEARRNGIQGFVTLKVLFSGRSKIGRIKVLKGLPAGLTENAIRAACKIEFKPAIKGGQPVGQWLRVEYVFRLADSSIFGP